ncbi:MAG: YkgJ family cysteine cluster protein [Gammaproteobacteria bacterium]
MSIDATTLPDTKVTCANCEACCCRLEVLLITETGVPETYIETDRWGGRRMARLDDGWCSALDRNTMLCTIYERRPWVCREFEMGSFECLFERAANL